MKRRLYILPLIVLMFLSGCMSDEANYDPTEEYDYLYGGYETGDETSVYTSGKSVTTESNSNSIIENPIVSALTEDTSTFSIDVDTASYSLFRKFVSFGTMPPVDSIRTEEMVNYFDYDYDQPTGDRPFAIETVLADCPWNSNNDLLMIGIQGKNIEYEEAPSNNIVFLIDVSGSMRSTNKLDMAKQSLALLVNNMREQDHISIVTYAGTAEVVLAPTAGDQTETILSALDGLVAGGGTNGSGGIELAYDLAYQNFDFEGNNRVVMATDGDFNVGTTSSSGLIRIVKEKAEIGIYLTILAFGQNHAAGYLMEELSNDGQGNYYFIDTLNEADKVLNHQIASTIVPIADDVKVQIEFNSDIIESYRLVGYENRVLNNDEFDDDNVDAGDLGAGHNVTAFYEITYKTVIDSEDDLAVIRLRYKDVGEDESKLIEGIIRIDDHTDTPSSDFMFASAIVEISLLMRNSEFKANADFDASLIRLEDNIGEDPFGLRLEFYNLAFDLRHIMGLDQTESSVH